MSGREFEIIARYFKDFITYSPEYVALGPGDDCAIVNVPEGDELCISTDTLVEGVHFPDRAAGNVAAHRSLCANLSDLSAMGAKPYAFTLALTMPEEDEGWLTEFSATLARLVHKYGIPLIGGNLARGKLSITLMVMGTAPKGESIRRSGASVGDCIFVTGTVGDAGGGLELLLKDPGAAGHLVDRYQYPNPRLEIGMQLRGIASAAIDISDGFVADLTHICSASRVGAEVHADDLPLSTALTGAFPADAALRLALVAGDDYELCFTAPEDKREEIISLAKAARVPITCVGEITSGSGVRVFDSNGELVAIDDLGYEHFHD